MHDTAYEIGRKFFELYWNPSYKQIVDFGSANVNGTLRDHCPSGCSYLGVDQSAGDGVNLVVVPGQNLPLAEKSADLIVSTSVFEHDPHFWLTFLELCKIVKDGGYIYINAPSNGYVHRYPEDCWRFYPDSARALVSWASKNGHEIRLVESFTANRFKDVWNDFVAVFQKKPFSERTDENCLFSYFSCTNILRGSDRELRNSSDLTEDQKLLSEGRSDRLAVPDGAPSRVSPISLADLDKGGEQIRALRRLLVDALSSSLANSTSSAASSRDLSLPFERAFNAVDG